MIKILICCGGGFSSSAMATKVKKEIKEKHLENEVIIDFQPFSISYEIMDQYDLIMACPHLKYSVPRFLERHGHNCIPIYLLPPKMYGSMHIEDVIEDAKDVVEVIKQTKMNPFHFPGEDSVMHIKRIHSYRKEHQL